MLERDKFGNNGAISARDQVLNAIAGSEAFNILVPTLSVGYWLIASIPVSEAVTNLADQVLEGISVVKTRLLQAQKQ